MTDYAAAAVQPIVQGLITVSLAGVLSFTGRGASLIPNNTGAAASVGRPNPPLLQTGIIVLTLDGGLPGNAGAIEPLPDVNGFPNPLGPAAPLPRALITMRAPLALGVPGPTLIASEGVTYGNFTIPAALLPIDGSLRQVMILLGSNAAVPLPLDPVAPNANGFEFVLWSGVESP